MPLPLLSRTTWATPDDVGRTTPIFALPSPFQSPIKNVSLLRPNDVTVSPASNVPLPLVSRLNTGTPLEPGRTTPIFDLPSPFQSPITKVSLFRPKKKTLSLLSNTLLPLESSENCATLDEVGRTTPMLSGPAPVQWPARKVSV